MRWTYESDPVSFPFEAYQIPNRHSWRGVSFRVRGWQLMPYGVWTCQDCGRSGAERPEGGGWILEKGDPNCEHECCSYHDEPEFERTGRVIVVMIGDDAHHVVDPDDLVHLDEDDYCHECGQIGCGHDGRDRSANR